MSDLKSILTPARVLIHSGASSKKRTLEQICQLCAAPEEIELFYQLLITREKLGSTALGEGVAIPHCRVPLLKKSVACFIKIEQGVDFDAPDRQPVYLVFGLFVPEAATQEHLDFLAHLAQIFSDPLVREKIKQAKLSEEIYNLLIAL
jgi:PTS system nitrogen regulatory IIA component